MMRNRVNIIVWFVVAVVGFGLLARFSISVGDDLGYMFADSSLHKGDGKMIADVGDCFSTQAKHYLSTNGRFLVHVVTHIFTAIASVEFFRGASTLMFGLLWLLVVGFITPRREAKGWYVCLLALFMLWVCVPAPGTVMLSLVAFAVNYMWTAVAYLGFLLLLKKASTSDKTFKRDWGCYLFGGFGALVVGSLQESYGLPISAALFFMALFNLKKVNALSLTMILGFFAGCGICVFAPGNWCHAAQGGGFAIDSILRKCEALSHELVLSAMALLLIVLAVEFLLSRKDAVRIVRDNMFFLIAILVSLLLGVFTFTSSRQLFCPSVFSIIVIGRIVMRWKRKIGFRAVSAVVMCCVLTLIFVGGYVLRKNTYMIHDKIMAQLGGKSALIVADATNANHNIDCGVARLFAGRYAPDPLANETLHLLFDGYTKRGLSRIGWENHKTTNIRNFIPYPAGVIEACFKASPDNEPIQGTSRYKAVAVRLDRKYKSVRIAKAEKNASDYMPFETEACKNAMPYEAFVYKDYRYIIIPNTTSDTIVLKR